MKKDTELFDYFLENEKKQKRVTIISSILFLLFATTIIVLGIYAHNQKEKVKRKDMKITDLQITIDSLVKIKDQKFITYQDSLTTNRDHVPIEVPTSVNTSNPTATQDTAIYKSTSYENHGINYTIFIQHMVGHEKEAQEVKNYLAKKKYHVPEFELINKIKFNCSVRYFYQADREKATQIARLAEIATNTKYKVQYTKIRAPTNQIEIWIGE